MPPNQGRGQWPPNRPADDWAAIPHNRGGYQPQYQSQFQHSFRMQGEPPHSAQRINTEIPLTYPSQHAVNSEYVDDRRNREIRQNAGSPEEGQILEEGQLSESPCQSKSSDHDRLISMTPNQQIISTPSRTVESSQPSILAATNHSPLSPANPESTEAKHEADHDPQGTDDRAKKPRLKFGGGLVTFLRSASQRFH